jgi:hypothetical protein
MLAENGHLSCASLPIQLQTAKIATSVAVSGYAKDNMPPVNDVGWHVMRNEGRAQAQLTRTLAADTGQLILAAVRIVDPDTGKTDGEKR